jgi:CPA1 family monovalent cation:H+ antiporter
VHEIELVLALLVPIAALAVLARRIGVPYPILLVLGGLALGLVPGFPRIELAPDLIFALVLPPLLYVAAFFTSIRDFRANLRPIGSLAVGLVLATAAAVAVVFHTLWPDLPWAVAFALGAIVAPPDAVAATAVLQRLGAPRRLVSILEGESLLNDATALVAYQAAVAAVVTGAFSIEAASLRFVVVAVGGIVVGLIVAKVVGGLRERLHDPPVEILISLLTPIAAYLPAEQLGFSGVLAAVTAGLSLGRRRARIMDAETRLSGRAVWDMLVFVLNGLVFILIGLHLPIVLADLAGRSMSGLLLLAVVVSLTMIAVRLVWTLFIECWLARFIGDPGLTRPEGVVVGWAGMRGVVSLAAVLALPTTLPDGSRFPERDLLVFLTFCAIMVTLVGQGLTLPLVMRWLGVGRDGSEEREELTARALATEAALARIELLAGEWPTHLPLVDTLRSQYSHRLSHLGEATADGVLEEADHDAEQEMIEHRRIRVAVLDAERAVIQDLLDRGAIAEEVLRRVERDIDLEELRMEA